MIISLSWPDKRLSPNDRSHWAKKAPIKKAYRNEAYWKAQKHGIQLPPARHPLIITFYPPDNAHRDIDNCLASLKAALDGIADALAINDKYFRPITIDFGESDKHNPRVTVEITTP